MELQRVIRSHFAKSEWPDLANSLGITLKSIQYQLSPKSPREVTFHFIGLLAVFYPASLKKMYLEFMNLEAQNG